MNDGTDRFIAGVYLLLHSGPSGRGTPAPDTRRKNKKKSRPIHRVMRWITGHTWSRIVEKDGESKL
jgi:hypothetical protein